MPNNDIVQIQIQPEILDIDTSQVQIPKSLKDRFVDLQKEMSKVISNPKFMTSALESVSKKALSAFKSADRAMKNYDKATEQSKQSTLAYADVVERLKAKQAELQALQNKARPYQLWKADIDRDGGFVQAIKRARHGERAKDDPTGLKNQEAVNQLWNKLATFHDYYEAIKSVEAELAKLSAEEQEFANNIKAADSEILIAQAELEQGAQAVQRFTNALAEEQEVSQNLPYQGVKTQVESTTQLSKKIATLRRVSVKTFSIMRQAIQRVSKVVSSLTSRISSLFKKLNKGNKGLNFNSKKLFKTFLQFGLGVRSLYFLIRRMRTEFINGMKQMAASFPEVNAQVSALTEAFNQLKGTSITMIQPILATVIPVLIRLMNVLSAVMEKIAMFFAVLRGQKVIYKATAANVDYSESVDDVGDSAKEANKELAEYDNLLVIQQPTEGSAGGGGGSGDDNPYSFEEAPIDAASKFAQKLKEAWQTEDFEGVGKIIAQKLNSITKKIDKWIKEKFEPTGIKWANRIARVGNGLFDGWNAKLAGKTIADFFNAIFKIVNEFATTFDWAQAGKKIGTFIVTAISNFDAKQAGETVRNLLSGMLIAGIELLKQNPGAALGKKLAEFINSLFDPNNGLLGGFLGQLINNVSSFFLEVFKGVDWNNIKEFLKTNFESLLSTIGLSDDSIKRIEKVFEPILNIIQGIVKFIENIDFETVLGSIIDLLGSISSLLETIWKILEPVLDYAVNNMFPRLNKSTEKLFDAIGTFLEAIGPVLSPILEIVMEIGTVITELVNSKISAKLQIVAKILEPIAKLLGKLLKPLQPILEITSQIVNSAIDEILSLVLELLDPIVSLLETFSDLLSPIFEILEPIFTILTDIINFALKPLFKVLKAIIHFLTGDFEAAGQDIKDLLGEVGTNTNKLKSDFVKFKDKCVEISTKVQSTFTKLKDSIVERFTVIKDKVLNLTNRLKTGISESWNKIKTNITTIVTNIREKVVTAWNNIKTRVTELAGGLKEKITTAWSKTKETVVETVGTIKEKVVGAWDTIKTGVVDFADRIKSGIEEKFNLAKDTAITIFEGLRDRLAEIWEAVWGVIKVPINWILGGIETLVNGVVNALNAIIGAINGIHFKIPDWMAKLMPYGDMLAGKEVGFNLGYLNGVSLPRLAQGAVIPPNKEFLAVLGDQSRGTNIEAPIDTIKQALAEVLSEISFGTQMPEKIQVVLPDGKVLAQTVWKEERKYYKQTGSSPVYS